MALIDLLAYVAVVWILTSLGRSIVDRFAVSLEVVPLDKNLAGFVLGLGVFSYTLLVVGLLGLLYPAIVCTLLALYAIAGLFTRAHGALISELRSFISRPGPKSIASWIIAMLFVLFAIVGLIGDFTPPSLTMEWDSLAYHLADPKMYAQAHRIFYIPWESHSNFAFTAEMWYLFGLMTGGVALAKLFHFGCAVGACIAIFAVGRAHINTRVGTWAALLFASLPVVLWESGTAYADLSTTFFATVTLLIFSNAVRAADRRGLILAAVLMGFTLSTKATSLGLAFFAAVGLFWWLWRARKHSVARSAGYAAAWALIAVAVGSPWYVKSTVYTGNPVYPFYYKVFGGKYFSAADESAYDQSNASFGMGRSAGLLLTVPWNATMYLLPGHPLPPGRPHESFNDSQIILGAVTPLFLAALFFPAFASSRALPFTRALSLYALGGLLFWFFTAQYVRYLLPMVPVFCLLAAWVLDRALADRWLAGYALAVLAVCSLAFSIYAGEQLVSIEGPVVIGAESKGSYLSRSDPAYMVVQYLNHDLAKKSKVAFYGYPLGFYSDRPYLWGEQGHSTYIPYGSFHSAADLLAYWHQIGVTDVLIDTEFNFARSPGYSEWVYENTVDAGPPLYANGPVALYAVK